MKQFRSRGLALGSPSNTLYVVMHGSICLVDVGDDGFVVYLLEMGNEHRYLYGNWLSESEIPLREPDADPARATLFGATAGNDSLDSSLNAVINIAQAPVDTDPYVRAAIRLPRPMRIHHCESGKLADNSIQGTGLVETPGHISDIRVFEYAFKDANQVSLVFDSGDEWSCPPFSPTNQANFAALHIYNEPGHELAQPSVHNRGEFNLCAKFLGSNLTLVKNTIAIEDNPAIPGLLDGELVFLLDRDDFVLDLIQNQRGSPMPSPVGSGAGQVCAGVNAVVNGTEKLL